MTMRLFNAALYMKLNLRINQYGFFDWLSGNKDRFHYLGKVLSVWNIMIIFWHFSGEKKISISALMISWRLFIDEFWADGEPEEKAGI
jgi:hypothetical protein